MKIVTAVTDGTCQWNIWKTIKLGTGLKTTDDFRTALKSCNCKINNFSDNILAKLPKAFEISEETDVDLVLVSVAELGFKDGASRKDIYNKCQTIGLELCPPEVGPQLRLQYKDQLKNEWLLIGMEPITDSDGSHQVFYVSHDSDGLWLSSLYGYPDAFWDGGVRWVFVRLK